MEDENIYSDEEISDIEDEINIYNISLNINDKLLIILEEEENYNDYICTILSFVVYNDIKYVSVSTENDFIYDLELENDYILKEQKVNKIIDIEKIIEFDLEDLSDVINIQLTKDIYPEVILEIQETEKKDYIYTELEKKENFITNLISSMNIYNNDLLLQNLVEMVNSIIELINIDNDNILDSYILSNSTILISNNLKRVYVNQEIDTEIDTEIDINSDNLVIRKNLDKELEAQFVHFNIEDEEINLTYNQVINNIYNNNYNSIQEYDFTDGYLYENFNEEYYLDNVDDTYFDNRKTRNELYYNTIIKNNFQKVILYKKENINIKKIILLPNKYNYFNIKYINNLFTLGENILLSKNTYTIDSNKQILNKIISENNLSTYDINNYDETIDYNNINILELNKKYTNNELEKALIKYMPKQIDIFNTFDKLIIYYIFNYNDLLKLFIKYNYNINNIDLKLRDYINKLISKNINRYKDLFNKFKIDKNIFKSTKKISIEEKIFYILNYIQKQKNILIKNIYIKKLINKFSREPKNKEEDNNFLYNIYNNTKLICKHHLYSCNINDDSILYKSLINNYGTQPIDGNIYCKHCGEFIDYEKMSIYQGFDSGDKPINNYATIEEEEEEDIFKNINNNDSKTKFLIELISNKININLNDLDKKLIIDLYNIINNELLASDRYENINITDEHPIIELNDNIDNRKKLKSYLINSNKLLFLFICILIFIQTSIPEYVSINSKNMNLLDLETDKYKYINEESNINIISIVVIDYMINRIKILSNKYNTNNFWKDIDIFLNEKNNQNIPSTREQIINTIKHLLNSKYNILLTKISEYIKFKKISNILIIKNFWTTYKPLPTNKNIIKINNIIIESINNKENKNIHIKNYNETLYIENISFIRSLNINDYIDLYKLLKIDISSIQNNSSFYYLYNYIYSSHGIYPENKYFNNLIKRFLNTINNEDINKLFTKYNWNHRSKQFNKNNIVFSNLKELITEIINYFNLNIEKDSLILYENNIKNNYDLLLLNSKPKRTYKYYKPEIFINQNYKNIKNKESIDKIFKIYCYDSQKQIIIDYKIDFYPIISEHIDFNTKINNCITNLEPSDDNLKKIMNDINSKNKIKLYDFNKTNIIDNNIHILEHFILFIDKNRSVLFNSDIDNIYKNILSYLEDKNDITKILNISFVNIFNSLTEMTNKIKKYINNTSNIEENRKKEINNKNGHNIKLKLINKFLNDIIINSSVNVLKKYIQNIKYIISKIQNYKNLDTCTKLTKNIYHTLTPKNWKLTDNNIKKLELFLSKNDFLLHNSIYTEKTNKKIDNGFYQYLKNIDIDIFYNFINLYTDNLDIINYDNNTDLNEYNIKIFLGYILLSIFTNIVDYCDNSAESENDLSNLLLDLIINIIQDYSDPRYINSIDFTILEQYLSKQKEREKQTIINTLDLMENDQRSVKVQLESAKIESYYKKSIKDNEKYLDTDAYAENIELDRNDHLNKFYDSFESDQFYSQTDNVIINPVDNITSTRDIGYGTQNVNDSDNTDSHEY